MGQPVMQILAQWLCTGLPGGVPVFNREAFDFALDFVRRCNALYGVLGQDKRLEAVTGHNAKREPKPPLVCVF